MLDPLFQHVRTRLSYDPETGAFTWIRARRDRVGKEAGAIDSAGHRQIRLHGRLYMAHRLAWLYMTGNFPEMAIDHANGVRSDNSWCNLREATPSQNGANCKLSVRNTSGAKGVFLERLTGRWNAYVRVQRKSVYLGTFDTVEEASQAYAQGARQHFGEFARVA